MPGPNPFTNPKAWSTMTFFGKRPGGVVRVPGVIESIDGHDVKEMWIVQKAQNSSFAVTIWRGRLLNEEIPVVVRLVDSAAFDAYESMRDRMQPKPPKNADTIAQLGGALGSVQIWNVVNGALNFAKINRVGVRSIGTPRAQRDLSWQATINLIQYRPRIVSKVGPPDPPKQESENDRLAKELDDAIKEAKQVSR
jgi:hypothetical protein